MLAVPDAVCCDRRVMAAIVSALVDAVEELHRPYLTCSLISSVVPAVSSHEPRNSSPRNGFSGFFSLPSFSLRLLYDCLRVVRNHFKTSIARFAGSGSLAGATRTEGCSAQYDENSVREIEERMKGGAVIEAMSPLKEAKDCIVLSVRLLCVERSAVGAYFEEARP